MQDEVKVSQADREAAANLYLALDGGSVDPSDIAYAETVRQGRCDDSAAVQAFARHRHQAERDTLARMEPVAWMPIRTAPRNETMIVLGGEGQQTWVGFFSGWNNYWTTGEVDRSRDHVMHTPQPTHWMPLPPAPEAGQ